MPVTKILVKRPESENKKNKAPVTIEWKGERMIRNHSIRASVDKIVRMNKTLDLVKINLIGDPSTGKSTLAGTIAHLVHKMAEIPYAVRYFTKDDLLNFKETLKSLSPTNYVLIFDDISFLGGMTTKRQLDIIKNTWTEIRHLPGGQDVKIIAIFNFHYTKGLDKYLRQSNFTYYTSIGSEESDNVLNSVGNQHKKTVAEFKQIWDDAYSNEKFSIIIKRKEKPFTYLHRNPYAPVLFRQGRYLQLVVFPKRQWIDKVCSICTNYDGTIDQNMTLSQFIEDFSRKFGEKGNAKAAVKIKLFQNGINGYPKRVKQAMEYIDQYMQKGVINLEELALAYGVNLNDTKLFPDKQPEIK